MTDKDEILFIQTGGTIDKDYPRSKGGYAFEFGEEPACARLIDRLNPSFGYKTVTAFQKDSLEVTDEDRQELAVLIEEASQGDSLVMLLVLLYVHTTYPPLFCMTCQIRSHNYYPWHRYNDRDSYFLGCKSKIKVETNSSGAVPN